MALAQDRILHVLTGCTAVGKTEAALSWAEENDAEIISCDSLLFYKGMDIGTAKPSRAELTRVPHHLIDICELADQMDISRYVELARTCTDDLYSKGKRILVTGGSGFYLKAFFSAVADDVEVSPELRVRVGALAAEDALAELRRLNPGGLGKLDTANPRRVIRALERCLASGKGLLQLADEFAARPSPFADWTLRVVQLDRGSADLDARIRGRVKTMLDSGLVDEVRRLLSFGLEQNPSAARAIGYREVIAMIKGELAVANLQDEIVRNTKALVKKQRTWFRTQIPPHRTINAEGASPSVLF